MKQGPDQVYSRANPRFIRGAHTGRLRFSQGTNCRTRQTMPRSTRAPFAFLRAGLAFFMAWALRTIFPAIKHPEPVLALNGIMSSALSALQTNSAALRVVSNNVANMNTQGYARRTVQEQALSVGGQLAGVDIADIQRVADQFLAQETLSAQAGSAQYGAENDVFTQLNGMLGQPGDGSALTTSSTIYSAHSARRRCRPLPAPVAGRAQFLSGSGVEHFGSVHLDHHASGSGRQQVTSSIGSVNSLIKQIYDLNQQINTANAAGDTASGLLDQRDQAVQNLSQLIGVRTSTQANGEVTVMTEDGVNLVGDTYAQLTYAGGATNGSYGSDHAFQHQSGDGPAIGASAGVRFPSGLRQDQGPDRHARRRAVRSAARNSAVSRSQTALAFNAQNNANAAFPPPTSLDGATRDCFRPMRSISPARRRSRWPMRNGNLVSRVDVDFDAGTISVDGGAATSFGGTIGGLRHRAEQRTRQPMAARASPTASCRSRPMAATASWCRTMRRRLPRAAASASRNSSG